MAVYQSLSEALKMSIEESKTTNNTKEVVEKETEPVEIEVTTPKPKHDTIEVLDQVPEYGEVFAKITEAKYRMSLEAIKPSGKNDYQKFEYLELKDFIPKANKIFRDLKLNTQFDFSNPLEAKLIVRDLESQTMTEFVTQLPEVTEKTPNKFIQQVGALQTYARRYLYIQMLDLTVHDEIDEKSGLGNSNNKRRSVNKQKPTKSTDNNSSEYPSIDKITKISSVDYAIEWSKHDIISSNFEPTPIRIKQRINKLLQNGKINTQLAEQAINQLEIQ